MLLTVHKGSFALPKRSVISICRTPTEKVSELLDFHLKPPMQEGFSYFKNSGNFLYQMKNLKATPNCAILFTAHDVELYSGSPHRAGFKAIKDSLHKRERKPVSKEDLFQMLEFVLKNQFDFNSNAARVCLNSVGISTKL